MNISERLRMVASLVRNGNTVFDCGCDHGLVPVWLVRNGVSPHAVASDVADGPLEAARCNIAAYGLESAVDTLKSDGLEQYEAGSCDTLIIAGMGGPLMYRIISADWEKTWSFRDFIFQPQSAAGDLRRDIRLAGMEITEENNIYEDGKYYATIRAVRSGRDVHSGQDAAGQRILDRYGPVLLRRADPVLLDFILREEKLYMKILGLFPEDSETDRSGRRKTEIEQLITDCRLAVREYYPQQDAEAYEQK
jgi:tRNA (adenine22-N1)-methyltransferase